MVLLVVATTEKTHIERAVIVVMVGVRFRVAAHLARLALDDAKAHRVLHGEVRQVAFGVAFAPCLLPRGLLFLSHYDAPQIRTASACACASVTP